MRRTTTEADINKKEKKPKDSGVRSAYKIFKDKYEIEAYFEKNGAVWATYIAQILGVQKISDLTEAQKDSFEFYVHGWVQYYDEITRNNAIEHVLYFNWDDDKQVVIWMAPPATDNEDPIKPPAGTTDPQSPSAPPPPYPRTS